MVLFFAFGKTTRTFFGTSKPQKILEGALVVVCFLLNKLFLLFCGILTCNCTSCAYLVAVYTVNTPSTGFEKTTRTFFPTSKPLNILEGALVLVCFLRNTLFLLFFRVLSCNCIICAYLVAVYTVNTRSTAYCLFLTA